MLNRIRNFRVNALIILAVASSSTAISYASTEILFDGSNLDAFQEVGNADWRITNDTVEATSGNGFLVTKESYDDFRLELEFYAEKDTNSGVFFRCMDPSEITDRNCYEANIFDSRPDPTYRTGGVTHISPPAVHLNSEGQWNTYVIQARGSEFQIVLNGIETARFSHRQHSGGHIALQFAKGGIKFRNVKVTRFSKDITGVWNLVDFTIR